MNEPVRHIDIKSSDAGKIIESMQETIAALEKILQEQMAVEEQPQEVEQEEIPEPEIEEQE